MENHAFIIKTIILAIIIFYLYIHVTLSLQESVTSVIHGQVLKQQVFLELYGLSIFDCKRECVARKDCKSFNYNRSYRRCQQNTVAKGNDMNIKLDHSAGSVYVEKSETWNESDNCHQNCGIGKWCNASTGTCHIKECGLPLTVSYADMQGNRREVGSKLKYTCTADSSMVQIAECFENGTWSETIDCPADCGDPPHIPNSSVLPGENKEGESRHYICDGNYAPESNNGSITVVVTCLDTAEWTPSNFICVVVQPGLHYIGCYLDKPDRDIYNEHLEFPDNTPEKCGDACFDMNYLYAGVQYSSHCFCGNSYGNYGVVPESWCNMPCPGNRAKMCGGFSVNGVYSKH